MELLGSIVVDGVAYSFVLFLISIGLAMTLGLMRIVNMAHGAFAMFGGFIVAALLRMQGMPFWAAVLLSIVSVAAASVPMERFLIRHFYRRPPMDQMLVTIGIMYVAIALASSLFGTSVTPMPLPHYLSGSFDLGFRTISKHRVAVIVIGLIISGVLWYCVDRSIFGIRVRAAVDNAPIAQAVGIDTVRVYTYAFAIGAALAALGGIAGAELLPLQPTYAARYLVALLAVVAVGGHGTLAGSLLASLILGLAETTAKYLVPDLSSIVFFATMFFILLLRPHGLLGKA
jgi:branched-chain amino acid transport system permease protein